MSELDEVELKATKKLNKTDTKILLDIREIDYKIMEFRKLIESMTDPKDYYYFHGVLQTLEHIKKGILSKL